LASPACAPTSPSQSTSRSGPGGRVSGSTRSRHTIDATDNTRDGVRGGPGTDTCFVDPADAVTGCDKVVVSWSPGTTRDEAGHGQEPVLSSKERPRPGSGHSSRTTAFKPPGSLRPRAFKGTIVRSRFMGPQTDPLPDPSRTLATIRDRRTERGVLAAVGGSADCT
jgi:hypothetical protein